jgi:hypothetical protein
MALVSDTVAGVAPDWSVELNRAISGEPSLVIMPPGADDAIGPTLVIHPHGRGFRLDRFQWDEYAPVAEFVSLQAVIGAVRAILSALSATPGSTLRH